MILLTKDKLWVSYIDFTYRNVALPIVNYLTNEKGIGLPFTWDNEVSHMEDAPYILTPGNEVKRAAVKDSDTSKHYPIQLTKRNSFFIIHQTNHIADSITAMMEIFQGTDVNIKKKLVELTEFEEEDILEIDLKAGYLSLRNQLRNILLEDDLEEVTLWELENLSAQFIAILHPPTIISIGSTLIKNKE